MSAAQGPTRLIQRGKVIATVLGDPAVLGLLTAPLGRTRPLVCAWVLARGCGVADVRC